MKPVTDNSLYAFCRFLVSIVALVVLALADLHAKDDTIPSFVYLLIGAMNGVDLYNLIRVTAKNKE